MSLESWLYEHLLLPLEVILFLAIPVAFMALFPYVIAKGQSEAKKQREQELKEQIQREVRELNRREDE